MTMNFKLHHSIAGWCEGTLLLQGRSMLGSDGKGELFLHLRGQLEPACVADVWFVDGC